MMRAAPSSAATPMSRLAVASSIAVLVLLASLHALSPELDPSWRMVSEYANGSYGWVLSLMFVAWALSSWALALAVWSQVKTTAGKVGLVFLVAAGIGEAMASIFDIRHALHSVAAMIGIPSLATAAMLMSVSLARNPGWAPVKKALLWTANSTWLSLVLMAGAFALFVATYKQAGGDMSAGTPITSIPAGVIAWMGWANRLVIIAYCVWVMTVAWLAPKRQFILSPDAKVKPNQTKI
jgi:hypothetical protein